MRNVLVRQYSMSRVSGDGGRRERDLWGGRGHGEE